MNRRLIIFVAILVSSAGMMGMDEPERHQLAVATLRDQSPVVVQGMCPVMLDGQTGWPQHRANTHPGAVTLPCNDKHTFSTLALVGVAESGRTTQCPMCRERVPLRKELLKLRTLTGHVINIGCTDNVRCSDDSALAIKQQRVQVEQRLYMAPIMQQLASLVLEPNGGAEAAEIKYLSNRVRELETQVAARESALRIHSRREADQWKLELHKECDRFTWQIVSCMGGVVMCAEFAEGEPPLECIYTGLGMMGVGHLLVSGWTRWMLGVW